MKPTTVLLRNAIKNGKWKSTVDRIHLLVKVIVIEMQFQPATTLAIKRYLCIPAGRLVVLMPRPTGRQQASDCEAWQNEALWRQAFWALSPTEVSRSMFSKSTDSASTSKGHDNVPTPSLRRSSLRLCRQLQRCLQVLQVT